MDTVNSALQKYAEAASGLTQLTRANAERIAKQLVKQGEVASNQVSEFASDLLDRSRKNRETLTTMINAEIQRAIKSMGLATHDEVVRLQKQVADLKRQLSSAGGSASTKKAAAKKNTKKSAAKKTAKKSSAKKSTS